MPFSAEAETRDLAIGHIATGVVLLGAIVAIGVIGYMLAGWPVVDALYMVIITIFGVGYGEVRSVAHPALKFFTMGLIVAGCSAGLWVIGGLVEFMADGKIREALGKRRMSQQIDAMTGHTIVCGFGRVGQILCRDLAVAGMPLLVIDTNLERLALAESLGYPTVAGDAAVMIVAVRKPDGEIRRSPHGTTLLEAGDAIIVMGRHGDLPRSLRRLAAAPTLTWRGSSKG